MPKINEYTLMSDFDELQLSVLEVIPSGKPRGVVQLVHGMCEHKMRYTGFMCYLAAKGYACVIHDHRGHGKSIKDKQDLGYMYEGGAEALLSDIHTVNTHIKETWPDLPVILLGHSMGSLAVRAYARTRDDRIDMLIVSGTPADNPASGIGKMIAKAEGRLKGARHRSTLLDKIAFAGYDGKFPGEGKFAWLSSDPTEVQAYNESDECGFVFTDNAFAALFDLMKQAYDADHWLCTKPQLPILFVSGENDPCHGGRHSFLHSVRAMRKAGYVNVKAKLYPGMRHEVLGEQKKEKVYKDILSFMEKYGC